MMDKSYKEAIKTPKTGAKNADDEQVQAWCAKWIGQKHCLRPRRIYEWACGFNIKLEGALPYLIPHSSTKLHTRANDALLTDILNDQCNRVKDHIFQHNPNALQKLK